MTHEKKHMHVPWILWPFWAIYRFIVAIIGLSGRLVAILGLVFMIVGVVLTLTAVVGAIVGIPLIVWARLPCAACSQQCRAYFRTQEST